MLRHIADNLEAGREFNHGLLIDGNPSQVPHLGYICYSDAHRYSAKSKKVTINGVSVECGTKDLFQEGEIYVVPDLSNTDLLKRFTWTGSKNDKDSVHRGIAFREKHAHKALAMAMAMLAFDESVK